MRKAKIVCTLGPASDSKERITALIQAGMNVARLNFSHGMAEEHRRRVKWIRQAAQELGTPVAILQDLQGPKIRVGRFSGGSMLLTAGEQVRLTTRGVMGADGVIPTPIKSLPRDVKRGDPVLLDDGRIRLRVERVADPDVLCQVEVGGTLKDRKGLNLPNAAVSTASVTRKDRDDLELCLALGVDYVALSFVRTAQDVERARKLLKGSGTPLIAKIEKPQAIDNLDSIIAVSDGVMVARGDLGVELPLEQVPALQKRMVREVNRQGRLVIVATEMLESMMTSSRPTRAEVSDVANAILDGADAVMLSGETAAGAHPVAAAATMARIVEETERSSPSVIHEMPSIRRSGDDVAVGIAAAAVAAARELGISDIIAYTESGNTARLVSEFRPTARVVALTPNAATVRRSALYWGVHGRQVARVQTTDGLIRQVRWLCREHGLCPSGSRVILIAGAPLNQPGTTNFLSIHKT